MSVYTEDAIYTRYKELVAKRDAGYAKVAELVKMKDQAVANTEKYRVEAADLGEEISAALGGSDWIALKKEISTLSRFLSKTDGVLASK